MQGIGQAGATVIGASVCLDEGCMQMSQELKVQSKSDIVNRKIMVDIVKVSRRNFSVMLLNNKN